MIKNENNFNVGAIDNNHKIENKYQTNNNARDMSITMREELE